MRRRFPFPPDALIGRTGWAKVPDDFDDWGRRIHDDVVGILPAGWSFEDKRVLDFGCGAGRALRHFGAEAEVAEIHGCDIDEPSIAWLRENLSPPFHVALSREDPPLPHESESFDLVLAQSVFTHLTDRWSAWLLELHRILRPGGLLVATFIGQGARHGVPGLEWSEYDTGMNVVRHGESWDRGGPIVLHSEWWIRAHWGRAFEVLKLHPSGFAFPRDRANGQGVTLLVKRPVELTPAELEAPEPGEPRELAALRANIRQLHAESEFFRNETERLSRELDAIVGYERTLSWRLTAPLRRVRSLVSRGRDGAPRR